MKISGIFITLALIMFTGAGSVYSMQKICPDDLRNIKGQASVAIEIDKMNIKSDPLTVIYTDDDGTGDFKQASAVIKIGSTEQSFNAITDETERNGILSGKYGNIGFTGSYGINSASDSKNLTIGIEDELPFLSEMERFSSGNKTSSVQGVQVYLPTIEMKISGGSRSTSFQQDGAINSNIEFCIREITGIRTMAILNGRVEISGR